MQKDRRHREILELIAQSALKSQGELVERLNKRGFGVTQASVSRDLEELGIVKYGGVYRVAEQRPAVLLGSITAINEAGPNLIVVRTPPGLASATAVSIDADRMKEIVGTIAGDDTIFIAVGGEAAKRRVVGRLRKIFAA